MPSFYWQQLKTNTWHSGHNLVYEYEVMVFNDKQEYTGKSRLRYL